MADEMEVPDGPERNLSSADKTRLVNIPLRDLPNPAEQVDEFANRFKDKYKPENLGDLIESIKLHGLLDPPIVAKDKDGHWKIIGGHRRVATLYVLVALKVPVFNLDMNVPCLEVLDASHLELVIRSIAGNELSQKLDVKERLLAVRKASKEGATKKEIAATVGVSEKAVDRDLKIVANERMLQHVLRDDLPPTAAAALVEAASKKKRLDEFLDYFDAWAQLTKEEIEREERRAKQERGKGLPANQMLVMNKLTPHLIRGWLEALAKGRPLNEEPDLGFEATFDKKSAVATIKVKVDAKNDNPEHVARVAGQVSQIAKHLAAFAKRRREIEGPEGPQAALEKDDALLDTALLKEFGLEDVADHLEKELRAEQKAAADVTPDENQKETKEGA